MSFCIQAAFQNPSTCTRHARDNLVDYVLRDDRSGATRAALTFLRRGYWVEIHDDVTKELLAGPFDPDQPAPSFVL